MQSTDALIDALTADVTPVRAHAVEQRLALAVLGGGALTALAVFFGLGVRADFAHALYGSTIWMKWAYTAAIGAVAVAGVAQLARPERRGMGWLWVVLVPVGLLAILAAL